MKQRAIVWFRQDLRLHDNEAIHTACRMADEVIPVFVFDERIFKGQTRFGFPKTGAHRAQFILESVRNLRENLRSGGSDLIVRCGKPEQILTDIARHTKASWVLCNRERTQEEVDVQDTLEQRLWVIGVEMFYNRGKMLYHTQDLPMPVMHTPDVFTQFRKENDGITPIRPPLPTPSSMCAFPPGLLEPGDLPELQNFGLSPVPPDARTQFQFTGGETTALQRLHHYLWETDAVANYKTTRNGLLGSDFSSHFSPWLSQGCLSPKLIYQEIKRYEQERVSNESTYWLVFELYWRDFFRLMGKKHGNRIFLKGGPQGKQIRGPKTNLENFQRWAEGRTGVPFIDANMRELNATGWMSNRGRQNVASFLVRDLKINWQIGAEYFESQLLDYDPCSNYGNWNYVAGVGADPREDRYFNILTQAKNYDPKGDFVRHWCTELAHIPGELAHRPDTLSASDRQLYAVNGYPKPMVRMEQWV